MFLFFFFRHHVKAQKDQKEKRGVTRDGCNASRAIIRYNKRCQKKETETPFPSFRDDEAEKKRTYPASLFLQDFFTFFFLTTFSPFFPTLNEKFEGLRDFSTNFDQTSERGNKSSFCLPLASSFSLIERDVPELISLVSLEIRGKKLETTKFVHGQFYWIIKNSYTEKKWCRKICTDRNIKFKNRQSDWKFRWMKDEKKMMLRNEKKLVWRLNETTEYRDYGKRRRGSIANSCKR